MPLAGCPLEERIPEFQMLKSRGEPLAALAMICVDNPMVAATGHRICNDCMKSCIYQKQDPVNIRITSYNVCYTKLLRVRVSACGILTGSCF